VSGVNSWYKTVTRIFEFCGVPQTSTNAESIKHSNKYLEATMKKLTKWNNERKEFLFNSKLDFFASLKTELKMSAYLKCNIFPEYKKAITKIRVSAHKLPIETGRYDNTDRIDRVCPLGCMAIGDEAHYLLSCKHPSFINIYHEIIEKEIRCKIPFFAEKSNEEKLNILLNNTDFYT